MHTSIDECKVAFHFLVQIELQNRKMIKSVVQQISRARYQVEDIVRVVARLEERHFVMQCC
jgi:hypothetical protein